MAKCEDCYGTGKSPRHILENGKVNIYYSDFPCKFCNGTGKEVLLEPPLPPPRPPSMSKEEFESVLYNPYYYGRYKRWLKEKQEKEAIKEKVETLTPRKSRKPWQIVGGMKLRETRRASRVLGRTRSLREKLGRAAELIAFRGEHVFHTYVDLPEVRCSIILDAVYIDGVTIGYNWQSGRFFVRTKSECWYMMDIFDDAEGLEDNAPRLTAHPPKSVPDWEKRKWGRMERVKNKYQSE